MRVTTSILHRGVITFNTEPDVFDISWGLWKAVPIPGTWRDLSFVDGFYFRTIPTLSGM